ncbi:MAG: YhbY family RNA-binding protein [Burkholderiales bacterium]
MTTLSPTQRRALKARAHALKPLVILGGKGLTDPVCAEVERALAAHELIKVRAAEMDRDAREAALAELCERCGAMPVQHIGKILVLFREKPAETPPAARRSERRESRSASRPRASARPPRRPRTSRSRRAR